MEKIESEIKGHFEEEKDLKSKIHATDMKIEESKSSILSSWEENEKNSGKKAISESIENKKMNLQLLQKAKDDLILQYNTLLAKRGTFKNVLFSNFILIIRSNSYLLADKKCRYF